MKKQTLENFRKNGKGVMDKSSLNSVTGGLIWYPTYAMWVAAKEAAGAFYDGFVDGWNAAQAEENE